MIDIIDKTHQPDISEIGAYIENPLFDAFCAHMEEAYGAQKDVAYSGDKLLPGWNVRFHKAGRTLCRLYPGNGRFSMLIVVGRKEKMRVEAMLPGMSAAMRERYYDTKEGMGQRWLLLDFCADDALYRDALALIAVRRESR